MIHQGQELGAKTVGGETQQNRYMTHSEETQHWLCTAFILKKQRRPMAWLALGVVRRSVLKFRLVTVFINAVQHFPCWCFEGNGQAEKGETDGKIRQNLSPETWRKQSSARPPRTGEKYHKGQDNQMEGWSCDKDIDCREHKSWVSPFVENWTSLHVHTKFREDPFYRSRASQAVTSLVIAAASHL